MLVLCNKKLLQDAMGFACHYGENPLLRFFLLNEHRGIDKWVHYFPIYDRYFRNFRNKNVTFLEIGVQNGGSLQMWKDYFGASAKIIGVDIEEECRRFADDQITVEIGSQEDTGFWEYIKSKYPRVDILLDDGGHTMNQQIVTYNEMFTHLSDGGIYLCEDLHTSYWEAYGGGLHKEDSFVEFCKSIVDDINVYHHDKSWQENYNTTHVSGIHFYDSIVVIEKRTHMMKPLQLSIGEQSPDIMSKCYDQFRRLTENK